MLEKEFLIALAKKTIVMIGFTYFSVAVAMQTFSNIVPAIIAGGAYAFTEMFRFYRLDTQNRILRCKKKKTMDMVFLI